MTYKFDCQYFGIGEKSIFLFRNRFPYKEIEVTKIKHIELTKGTDVKRPVFSYLFGGILISISVYLIINFSGLGILDVEDRGSAKSLGYLIILEAFLILIGSHSIYRTLPIHWIIKITLMSGETECLPISEIIKSKTSESLIVGLKDSIENNKIFVSPKFPI